MKTFATISATFSGNRGAEAMLRSMIENITQLMPDSSFKVLSVYPHADVLENDYANAEVIDARPKVFLTRLFLQSFAYRYLRKIPADRLCPAARAILASDLVLDISGVTFVDGRGLPLLIYNALCVLIPRWLGVPVMKVSQAMGPFESPLNRATAKFCLSRVAVLCSRGEITSSHLRQLGISSFYHTADAAFSLPERPGLPADIREAVRKEKEQGRRVVGICPSVVVEDYCRKLKMDYRIIMNKFIDHVLEQGFSVVLFPHSAREHSNKRKNNDLPLCADISRKRKDREHFIFIGEILNAFELRSLIAECDLFVGSRFHSVISALCVSVPFFLVGWSHKYVEVLDMFCMGDLALDFKDLTVQELCGKFEEIVRRENEIKENIKAQIGRVKQSSRENARLAIEYPGGRK